MMTLSDIRAALRATNEVSVATLDDWTELSPVVPLAVIEAVETAGIPLVGSAVLPRLAGAWAVVRNEKAAAMALMDAEAHALTDPDGRSIAHAAVRAHESIADYAVRRPEIGRLADHRGETVAELAILRWPDLAGEVLRGGLLDAWPTEDQDRLCVHALERMSWSPIFRGPDRA